MRCCASPTTSSADPPSSFAPTDGAHDAAITFETLLFGQTLKPLADSLGFYGDVVTGACAQSVARSLSGDLTDRLARLFTPEAPQQGGVPRSVESSPVTTVPT